MPEFVKTRVTVVWFILCSLTIVSWVLGIQHGFGSGSHVPASVVIILVAAFKIRLVGLYFMELRTAPRALRGIFECYCLVLTCLLTGLFLLA